MAIGSVTRRTLYSYRSGSHVLSILVLIYSLGLGIGFGLALGFGLESKTFAFLLMIKFAYSRIKIVNYSRNNRAIVSNKGNLGSIPSFNMWILFDFHFFVY